jgi:hypothetical protein
VVSIVEGGQMHERQNAPTWASLAAWFLLRQMFGARSGQVKLWDKDVND